MNYATYIGSSVLALALAGAAWGQSPVPQGSSSASTATTVTFGSADTNKDGRLSSAEVKSHAELNSAFSGLDTNKDGYLSQAEYDKWNSSGRTTPRDAAPLPDPGKSPGIDPLPGQGAVPSPVPGPLPGPVPGPVQNSQSPAQ